MRIELRYGFILAIVNFLWLFMEYALGIQTTTKELYVTIDYLALVPIVTIYVLALRAKRQQQAGLLTWGQGFRVGIMLTLIAAAFNPLFNYIYYTLIHPGFFAESQAYSVQAKLMSAEEAARYFTVANYIALGIMGMVINGVIASLIVATVLKRT
ncbi:MAG: DUF4199 domain-containing protein [Siphonobacter sp.]